MSWEEDLWGAISKFSHNPTPRDSLVDCQKIPLVKLHNTLSLELCKMTK